VTKVVIENTKAVKRHRVTMKNLSARNMKKGRLAVIIAVEKIRRRKRKKKRKN
jgi:diphthamide synthase subunit DPH2